MTTLITASTVLARRARTLLLALGAAGVAVVLSAAPAAADVPEGWSDPAAVDPLGWLLVLVGLPVLGVLVLTALVYGPPLARGERVAPGAPAVENQWIGGPRRATGELAGPDGDDSQAGGSSARW
ncbi:hypothetical protein QWJ41_03585 [Nocardioides sp. SOB44]|uniref:Uncharacterized protein n=1 Tax=Nocardioides cremeus TaxID=3058044 RepID=A0ABT8TP82_9ACTN|nr:hypothetical protein [Nocardioides cremeus]MDO3394788.1 hypothetical protein [Nocardioides cremeus]